MTFYKLFINSFRTQKIDIVVGFWFLCQDATCKTAAARTSPVYWSVGLSSPIWWTWKWHFVYIDNFFVRLKIPLTYESLFLIYFYFINFCLWCLLIFLLCVFRGLYVHFVNCGSGSHFFRSRLSVFIYGFFYPVEG